jgi:hypothetical protein
MYLQTVARMALGVFTTGCMSVTIRPSFGQALRRTPKSDRPIGSPTRFLMTGMPAMAPYEGPSPLRSFEQSNSQTMLRVS